MSLSFQCTGTSLKTVCLSVKLWYQRSEWSHAGSCICSQSRHVHESAFAFTERAKSTLAGLVSKWADWCEEKAEHWRCNDNFRV